MSSQPAINTDNLIERISAIFQPQFKEIKEQLDDLVTRREHDKDITELTSDIANQQKQVDRLQTWADQRPRQSADADWVRRIETDVRTVEQRMAQQPAEARATLNTILNGGGCLYMVVGLLVMIFFQAVSIAVSVGLALLLRGG